MFDVSVSCSRCYPVAANSNLAFVKNLPCVCASLCYRPHHFIHISPCLYRLSAAPFSFKFHVSIVSSLILIVSCCNSWPPSISLLMSFYLYFPFFWMLYPQHVRCQYNATSATHRFYYFTFAGKKNSSHIV